MNAIQNALMVTGALTLGLIALGVTLACLGALRETIRDRKRAKHQKSHEEGVQRALRVLEADALWFVEDAPTENLIRNLGKGMRVDEARSRWRYERSIQADGGGEGEVERG